MTLINKKGPALGLRHMQTLLLFLVLVVLFAVRLNIGVAVVAMTNAETTNPNFQEFDWNEKQKSFILSSFFFGSVFTQISGGRLCKRFGVKWVLSMSTIMTGLLSVATPWLVVKGGWKMFCTIRVILGLVQGPVFPAVHTHLANWCPPTERNRLGSVSHTGVDCGTVIALAISGIIAEGSLGWPGIFYVFGALCFAWCILWFVFGYNNAIESKFITKEEQNYIETSLGRANDFHKKTIPIPWKAILTSVPFISLTCVRCAQMWGLSTIKHQIPSYLHGVFNLHIKHNGLYSALPFLAMWILSYVFLIIADILQHKKLMSLLVLRRTFSTIASWLPAVGLIGIGFLDVNNKALAITLLTILVGINSAALLGIYLNTIDLSPNHAGILTGISNTLVSCMPMITPLVVGWIVTNTHDRSQWQIVFAITAAIFFFGNLIYIIWGAADTQPWDAEDFLTANHIQQFNNTRDCNSNNNICNSIHQNHNKENV